MPKLSYRTKIVTIDCDDVLVNKDGFVWFFVGIVVCSNFNYIFILSAYLTFFLTLSIYFGYRHQYTYLKFNSYTEQNHFRCFSVVKHIFVVSLITVSNTYLLADKVRVFFCWGGKLWRGLISKMTLVFSYDI